MKPIRIPANKNLPDLPSAILRLAMADLEKVENDPRYTVHMSDWHSLYEGEEEGETLCHVCLAGSVMAKTMEVPIDLATDSSFFNLEGTFEDWRKLTMLDFLRTGCIAAALDWVHKELPESMPSKIAVTDYADSPIEFKYEMEKIATMLEDAGL